MGGTGTAELLLRIGWLCANLTALQEDTDDPRNDFLQALRIPHGETLIRTEVDVGRNVLDVHTKTPLMIWQVVPGQDPIDPGTIQGATSEKQVRRLAHLFWPEHMLRKPPKPKQQYRCCLTAQGLGGEPNDGPLP